MRGRPKADLVLTHEVRAQLHSLGQAGFKPKISAFHRVLACAQHQLLRVQAKIPVNRGDAVVKRADRHHESPRWGSSQFCAAPTCCNSKKSRSACLPFPDARGCFAGSINHK